jgi:hypothetical protein
MIDTFDDAVEVFAATELVSDDSNDIASDVIGRLVIAVTHGSLGMIRALDDDGDTRFLFEKG